jgi:hypothetical protein
MIKFLPHEMLGLNLEAKRSQFSIYFFIYLFKFSIYSVFNYWYGSEGTGTTRGLTGVTWWKEAALNLTEAGATLTRKNRRRFTYKGLFLLISCSLEKCFNLLGPSNRVTVFRIYFMQLWEVKKQHRIQLQNT